MNIKWTQPEKNFLKENSHCMKDSDIASKLTEMSGRTVTLYAVRKMRQKMGIKKQNGRGKIGLATNELQTTTHQIHKSENKKITTRS